MRFTSPRRTVRAAVVTAAASALLVGGATAPASAAKPVVPSPKTFVDHTVNGGADLTFKVGGSGKVKRWSITTPCDVTVKGTKAKFTASRLKTTKKSRGNTVTLDLRAVSKKVVVGTVKVKSSKRGCSGTAKVVTGTAGAWKNDGEAIGVNSLTFYAGTIDWAARDYKQRTGRFPSSKAKLVRHAKRLGITSYPAFGERVSSYTAKRKGRSFVLTVTAPRITEVGIEISSAGRFDWVF